MKLSYLWKIRNIFEGCLLVMNAIISGRSFVSYSYDDQVLVIARSIHQILVPVFQFVPVYINQTSTV